MAIPTDPNSNSIAQQLRAAARSIGRAAVLSVRKPTAFLRTVAKSIIPVRIWRAVISPFTLPKRLYQRRVDKRKESERSAIAQQYGQHSRDYYLYCKETGRPFSKMAAVKARFGEEIQNIFMDIESLRHKDPKKAGDHVDRYLVFRDKLRGPLNDFGSLKDIYDGLERISSDPAFPYLMIKFNELCEEFDLSSQLVKECGTDSEVKTDEGFNKLYCEGYDWLRLSLGTAVTGKNRPGYLKEYLPLEQELIEGWQRARNKEELIAVVSRYLPDFGSEQLLEDWFQLAIDQGIEESSVRASVSSGQMHLLTFKNKLLDVLDKYNLQDEYPVTHRSVKAGIRDAVFLAKDAEEVYDALFSLKPVIGTEIKLSLRDYEFGKHLEELTGSHSAVAEKVVVKMKLYLSLRQMLGESSGDGARKYQQWETELLEELSGNLDSDGFIAAFLYSADLSQLPILANTLAVLLFESKHKHEFEDLDTGYRFDYQFLRQCSLIDPVRVDFLNSLQQLIVSLHTNSDDRSADALVEVKKLFNAVIVADSAEKLPDLIWQIAPQEYQVVLLTACEEAASEYGVHESVTDSSSVENDSYFSANLRSTDGSGE